MIVELTGQGDVVSVLAIHFEDIIELSCAFGVFRRREDEKE